MSFTGTAARAARVMLVDDNPGDIFLMREALAEVETPVECSVAVDGHDALQQLVKAAENDRLPDLIILDLNMPRVSGLELLGIIRQNPDLLHLPVVVMTSSTARKDVMAAYSLHANSYLSKPMDAAAFFDAMRGLERYWLALAVLPPQD